MNPAQLEGGCYVVTPDLGDFETRGGWSEALVVHRATGARAISTYLVRVGPGRSPVRRFPGSDVVLYVVRGEGRLILPGGSAPLRTETGVYVAPGEPFAVENLSAGPLELWIGVCPQCEAPEWSDTIPDGAGGTIPGRIVAVDEQERQATADRFYQILVDRRVGSEQVTQFIGHIPRSRSPQHYPLYEEAILVLSGEGRMWAGKSSAPVAPGSMIYLPRRQSHCLECTAEDGMSLVGLFYPAGSPAAAY